MENFEKMIILVFENFQNGCPYFSMTANFFYARKVRFKKLNFQLQNQLKKTNDFMAFGLIFRFLAKISFA
jgi:hypothetical protein